MFLNIPEIEIIGVSIDRAISPVVEFSKNVGINYVLIHDPMQSFLKHLAVA